MNYRVQTKTVKRLFSLPHVVGVGYGLKETGGKLTDEKGIVVLVSRKVPMTELARDQVVPRVMESRVTDVLEVGKISARRGSDAGSRSRWRPAPGGVSIGHYLITSGTLGAVVYDRSSGNKLILSNNHVLANETNGRDNRAQIGDPVLQPGPSDGGRVGADKIGRLYRFVPLQDQRDNLVDSAVAKPLESALVNPSILGIGMVTGTALPHLGMTVKKFGRTTGFTHGLVRAVNVRVEVDYNHGRLLKFKDQILVDNFDKPGDSGSVVVDDSDRAVGLLFAGSERFTILNPIGPVLESLRVHF